MSDTTIITTSTLTELASQINVEHERARGAFTKGFEHAMRAGELLLTAREAVPHGQWLPWLGANCDIPARTAQLYMRVARERHQLEAKSASLAHLTLEGAASLISRPRLTTPTTTDAGRFVPCDGCMLIGTIERQGDESDMVVIAPSKYPDHFYVTCFYFAEDGGQIEGMRRPVRGDCIGEILGFFRFDASRATWETATSQYVGPLDYNMWLYISHEKYMASVLGKAA